MNQPTNTPEGHDIVDAGATRAEALVQTKRPGQAEQVLRDLLVAHPTNPRLLAALVEALHHQHKNEEALEVARTLVGDNPNSTNALIWYSRASRCVEPNPEAIRRQALPVARRAVALSPNNPDTHLELGHTLCESASVLALAQPFSRYLAEADDVARTCIELAPNWSEGYLLAARVARQRGQRHKADTYAQQALTLSPTAEQSLRAAYHLARDRDRRREIADRLAVTSPSLEATDAVVSSHRATPHPVISWVLLIAGGAILADRASRGVIPGAASHVWWAVGPVTGLWIAAGLGWFRKHRLASFEGYIRDAIQYRETEIRWIRRGGAALLAALPVMWLPAALAGSHPGAWAVAWVYAGALAGMALRPRVGPPDPSKRSPP